MLFLGMIIGSPVMGWLSDRIARRVMPMIVGAIAGFVVIMAVMFVPGLSMASLLVLFFLLGFIIATQNIGYPLIVESNPPALTGASEGLASVLIMAGGFAQPFFAWLMGLGWNHLVDHGMPVYTLGEYRLAMGIMPVAFVIALICALRCRETSCEQNAHTLKQEVDELDASHGTTNPSHKARSHRPAF